MLFALKLIDRYFIEEHRYFILCSLAALWAPLRLFSGVIVYCSDIDNWISHSVGIQIADDFFSKWS